MVDIRRIIWIWWIREVIFFIVRVIIGVIRRFLLVIKGLWWVRWIVVAGIHVTIRCRRVVDVFSHVYSMGRVTRSGWIIAIIVVISRCVWCCYNWRRGGNIIHISSWKISSLIRVIIIRILRLISCSHYWSSWFLWIVTGRFWRIQIYFLRRRNSSDGRGRRRFLFLRICWHSVSTIIFLLIS